jgi:hypothetical protein
MLTNEKYDTAHAMAANDDKAPPVIIEYITMPKDLRHQVSHQVYDDFVASGLPLEDYVKAHHDDLAELADRSTMQLTTLIAFVLDIVEEQAAGAADAEAVPET